MTEFSPLNRYQSSERSKWLELGTKHQRKGNCTDEGLGDLWRGPFESSAEYYLYTHERKQAEARRKSVGREEEQ